MTPQEGTLTRLAREVFAQDGFTASSWDGALHGGSVVGRFELIRELGRGGFGSVWEARDTRLKRRVAFKAIERHALADADQAALAEAEAAAHLSHPNIVTLFDVGRSENGPYLVMELLSGRSVRDATRDGPLPVREALRIAIEVLRGLEHAHGKGLLHRDLTPANVFLCDDGAVKLLDLGLSHALAGTNEPGPTSAGTPGYAPPERLRGDPEDERSDLFGVGALLLLMLSGKRPGDDALVEARRLTASPALARLVERLLDPDPSRRPASALDARSELERILQEQWTDSPAPAVAAAKPLRVRPSRGIAVIATFVVAAAAAFLGSRIANPHTASAPLLSVTVAAPVIGIGDRTRVSAFSVLQDGKREPLVATTWRSSHASIAAVDAQGNVTGRAPGTAQISASARGAEGSNSIIVSGPEWLLVHVSDMAPPPTGTRLLFRGREGTGGQGPAVIGGRPAWRQTSPDANLAVPIPLAAGVDRFALQLDFWAPIDAEGRQSLVFVPFAKPGDLGGPNLEFDGAPRWRTIRVEGSRERCALRFLVDGAEVPVRGSVCNPAAILRLGMALLPVGDMDVAWSNLRIFQGTPVASVPVTIQRLAPGAEVFARAHATPADAAGNPIPGCTIRWTSSDPSVATVDAAGAVRALRRGEVTIAATTEGRSGSTRLRVEPPARASAASR